MGEDLYAAALTAVKHVTPSRAKALIRRFGGAKRLWETPERELRAFSGMTEPVITALLAARKDNAPARMAETLARLNAAFIAESNPQYPALLSAIEDPPVGLFLRGKLPSGTAPFVAVVGSRRCSDYGMTAAEDISRGLAAQGAVVVSGMARGIDGRAHAGALEGKGKTVAVLGCGVDVCYPPEHRGLMEQIAAGGAIVSEYPPGAQPEAFRFPARNRIISGLCAAVLVVESEERSGTSITVSKALEQGRAVLAVPGSIYSKFSRGTNYLIYLGATPVTSAEDVLFELRKAFPAYAPKPEPRPAEPAARIISEAIPALDKTQELVYACIDREPAALDDVLRKSAVPIAELRGVLLELELSGRIRRLPGDRYSRVGG